MLLPIAFLMRVFLSLILLISFPMVALILTTVKTEVSEWWKEVKSFYSDSLKDIRERDS